MSKHFQGSQIVGEHALKVGESIFTGELDHGAIGEVKDYSGVTDCFIFAGGIAELIRKQPAILFDAGCPLAFVQIVYVDRFAMAAKI